MISVDAFSIYSMRSMSTERHRPKIEAFNAKTNVTEVCNFDSNEKASKEFDLIASEIGDGSSVYSKIELFTE